jgi:hypothetical protein
MVFMKLLGRLHAEGDLLPRILTSQFGDVLQRFGAALRAALPDLPPEELFWRLNLAIGAWLRLCAADRRIWKRSRIFPFLQFGGRAGAAGCFSERRLPRSRANPCHPGSSCRSSGEIKCATIFYRLFFWLCPSPYGPEMPPRLVSRCASV